MHDRLSDQDIEAIFRGDAEDGFGLAGFLTRVRSSAEWSPDPETQSGHVMAAANAVNSGALGKAPGQPPVRATEPAMKGIRLKIRTLTRSALTWVVAAATVLFGTTGALAATSHLPQAEPTAVSNAASKIGRDLPDLDDAGNETVVVEDTSEDDQIPAVTTTTIGDDSEGEHVEGTTPENQTPLIVVDPNQTPPNGGCTVDEQDGADESQLDQNQAGELDENETDQPEDHCEIENTETENDDQAEVEDAEEHDQKQASDVSDNEVESENQSQDTEVEDHESEDDYHSGDTQEHDSGDHESEGSSHEGSGD